MNTSVIEQIDKNAMSFPDKIAYYYDGMDDCLSLSYHQLRIKSNRIAMRLLSVCKTDKPIIVYGHKDPYMILSFLACVKSGHAYVPIDSSTPLNRVEDIIREVCPEIIIAVEPLNVPGKYDIVVDYNQLETIANDDRFDTVEKRLTYLEKDDTFYIIFTSGSTGKPKGVQITRDCLDNFCLWGGTIGDGVIGNIDGTIINTAPFSFDLSVMDLYLGLYYGNTVWAIDKERTLRVKRISESILRSKGKVIVATPSYVNLWFADRDVNCRNYPEILGFIFCGEVLTKELVRNIIQRFPDAKIVNTYGPTESTVAVTEIEITDDIINKYESIPVGRVKEGTNILIMKNNVPNNNENEKGEIVICGNTVSTGYYNRPDLTQKTFYTDKKSKGLFSRNYKTGDEGFFKDGLLFYVGRIDNQVKLNGYRIELEDVEKNLMKMEYVQHAVVIPQYKDNRVIRLVAFVIVKETVIDGGYDEIIDQIRKKAEDYLPKYMIPRTIYIVDRYPVNNNGKIDRKALLDMI